MTIIGYARVSTTDQDLSIQEAALRAAGCEVIRAEKRSGTTTEGREEPRTVLDFLRPNDVLMVTRVDRLARSIGDLQEIVRTVKARGAADRCRHGRGEVLPRHARGVRRIRNQSTSRAAARRHCQGQGRGVYKGRQASIDAAKVRQMKAQGLSAPRP